MLDFSAIWFKDAFRQRGCPICYLQEHGDARYIFSVLYEFVTDGPTRAGFVDSLGYCREHAWAQQMTEKEHWNDGMGTATMYESVLDQNLMGLDQFIKATRREIAHQRSPFMRGLARWGNQIKQALPRLPIQGTTTARFPFGIVPCKLCRVCETGNRSVSASLDTFANKIEWDEFRDWYRASDGLCLPHLNAVLERIAEPALRRFVVEVAVEKLEENAAALREYLRKRDYRFKHEPLTAAERDSWRRAVEQFVGKRRWKR